MLDDTLGWWYHITGQGQGSVKAQVKATGEDLKMTRVDEGGGGLVGRVQAA